MRDALGYEFQQKKDSEREACVLAVNSGTSVAAALPLAWRSRVP